MKQKAGTQTGHRKINIEMAQLVRVLVAQTWAHV